ncbi:Rbn Ribonuclease BN family enzyme [Burkholderiaceae bacterium]|jgi:membrane protein
MQLPYSIQRWLPLGKELWERNQHLKLNQVSASLAFTTILSLVPVLTVGSYLVSTLPGVMALRATFQTWLLKNYFPGGISQQISNYLAQFSAKAKELTLVGSIGLLITTILTMIVIERAFNEIWQVKQRRPFLKRMLVYLAATVIGPLLLGLGIYLSGVLLGSASGWFPALSSGFKFMSTIVPSLLAFLVFALAYRILPYAKVKWRDALIGALFAGAVYELTKFGFTFFITQAAFYKTVYGTFAIVPLMLIWIYITWWVTLAGAVIVANMPTIRLSLIQERLPT